MCFCTSDTFHFTIRNGTVVSKHVTPGDADRSEPESGSEHEGSDDQAQSDGEDCSPSSAGDASPSQAVVDDGPETESGDNPSCSESESGGRCSVPERVPSSPDSILSKKTMLLGDTPSPSTESDSSSHFQCSQVSTGWLGRAYNQSSRAAKKHEDKELNMKRVAKELQQKQSWV